MINSVPECIEQIKKYFLEYGNGEIERTAMMSKLSAAFAFIPVQILCSSNLSLSFQEQYEYEYMREMYKEFMRDSLSPLAAKSGILSMQKSWLATQTLDEMLTSGIPNKHEFSVIDKKDLKKTVYVDMNVMSALIEQIEIMDTGDYQFVYSPEHIEDFVFSKLEYHIPSLEAISSITDNITVAYYERGGYTYGKENAFFVYKNRVLPDIENIRRAKDMKAIDYSVDLENEYHNPSKYNGAVPIDNPFIFITKFKDDIDQVLSRIGAPFRIEDLIISKSENIEYSDCNPIIHYLYQAMDKMGFQQDTISESKLNEATSLSHDNYRKIRSSRLDIEHILYGSCCDYFVTLDKKLYFRASIIIKLLNRKCKVIHLKHQQGKSIYEEILNTISHDSEVDM